MLLLFLHNLYPAHTKVSLNNYVIYSEQFVGAPNDLKIALQAEIHLTNDFFYSSFSTNLSTHFLLHWKSGQEEFSGHEWNQTWLTNRIALW